MNDQAGNRAQIGYSLVCLVGALVLAVWFVTRAGAPNFAGDSLVNSSTWPRAMLLGIAACAAVLLLRSGVRYLRHGGSEVASADAGGEFNDRKAALGIAILIGYVAAIPLIGFAFATLTFFLAWLPYGKIRRVRVILSVAIIGTVVLLYTFAKVTTMPLDRGIGPFNDLTVALYRLLGIY